MKGITLSELFTSIKPILENYSPELSPNLIQVETAEGKQRPTEPFGQYTKITPRFTLSFFEISKSQLTD